MTEADEGTFEATYREHWLSLVRLAWLLTGSRDDAEDTVHDVFLRFRRVDPAPDHPLAYLRRMVINDVTDRARRRKIEARHAIAVDLAFDDPEIEETWALVAELAEGPRRALVLRYYLDLPLAEIAEVMGVPVGTVKSWLHRGLTNLRRSL
jgi:RNA polymerase sigma factor (sigma-70 family)